MTRELRTAPGAGGDPARRAPGATPARLGTVVALLGLGLATWSAGAAAQEEARGDTVPPADTTMLEASRPPPRFPAAKGPPDSSMGAVVESWGREELLDAGALGLLDFLLDEAPELLQLRAGHYAGPHHLMDGLLGPGFVEVEVDGRTVSPLEGGQADLAAISLSRVERVRLVRRAGRTVLQVTTLHHGGGEAYSRIGAGTGQPGADLIHGLFANGIGSSGAVAGGVDYLNIAAGSMPATRLDAWARAAWMPVDNGSGLELTWKSESVERTAVVASEFDRSELFLHGRANVSQGIQAEFWVGTEKRTPEEQEEDDSDGAAGEVEAGVTELRITATGADGWTRGQLRLNEDPAYPDLEARWSGGVRAAGPLFVSGAASYGRWDRFETWDVGAELGVREEVFGIRLDAGIGAATGRRGVSRAGAGSADSVSFDAVEARLGLEAAGYTLAGRATYRELDPMPTFGGRFDRDLSARGAALARTMEGRLQGPLVPVDGAAELFRVSGAWRHRFGGEADPTLYLPTELIQGSLAFVDRFFEDNLEIRASMTVHHRSEMLAPIPGLAEPEILPAETSARGGLLIQINEFRLWWRGGNLRTMEQQDFGGLVRPLNRNLVGITWEFRN